MNESMVAKVGGPCIGTRKNGQPCRGIGRIFDPDLNGWVCEWHTGPQLNKQRRKVVYLERAGNSVAGKSHIPSDLVVDCVTAQRKPPEVRIWRLSNQSRVGTVPPSTSTPHGPTCWARRW